MTSKTLQECYLSAKQAFKDADIATAELDADLLVSWLTATSRLDRVSNPELVITHQLVMELDSIIKRRLNGEPVHRIMGKRNFYGRDFWLNSDTLEPRPDTETLIDVLLPYVRSLAQQKDKVTIIDMGTGSGAIAVTLACEEPKVDAIGVDISQNALDMAKSNAARHGVEPRFTPLYSNWFENIVGKFDIIASNPPYIPHKEIEELDIGVRQFDPMRALDGGIDGLDFYRQLAEQSRNHLNDDGYIALEIGMGQEKDVNDLFDKNGFILVEAIADLSAIIRVLIFKNKTDN
ncbi:peptide chain release factor N(5)-glutamine methyltransferase [Bartonella sp. HY038]|uniref:peptide chain release factor N(5)-glutamine methyltransferase n=1 Tax=Bartonella sp. HY038 TaxID=2759660 RepID=UPI0015F9A9A5|nr:peptide chain release factor N(5)-glutamine methyltransferase [Bartonella sp. HY038]